MTWTPAQWEGLYHSNTTLTLAELGLGAFTKARVIVTEKPPLLQSLDREIESFWEKFVQAHPSARNEPKLGIRGPEDLYLDDENLIVKSFLTSYAAVRFKNTRAAEDNQKLSDEKRDFLDNHFLTLGAGAYVTLSRDYLLGKRAEGVARAGLVEYVPQGLADPRSEESLENIFEDTVKKELKEESGLEITDILQSKATHVNIGPKYGDFTLIYRMIIDQKARSKVRANPKEHTDIFWRSKERILEMMQQDQYALTPVTVALFDKIIR